MFKIIVFFLASCLSPQPPYNLHYTSTEVRLYPGEVGLSGEKILVSVHMVDPVTPMYYQDWYYHLGGK